MATAGAPKLRPMQIVGQEQLEFEGDPIVLVGDPRGCAGLLVVRNPHDVPVKLKRIALRAVGEPIGSCADPSRIEIRTSAALCAGGTQQLRVRVRVPAGTPPGRYEARLDTAGGAERPVQIHVLERRRTRLSPPAMTRGAASGATIALEVNAINLGNVQAVIPERAPLELHAADRGWPFHFHAAAKSHGSQGHQAFLDSFVERIGDDEPAVGRARVKEGAGPLAPQQGRLLAIELSLPKKLRSGRTYRGLVRLADAVLRITLHIDSEDEATRAPG